MGKKILFLALCIALIAGVLYFWKLQKNRSQTSQKMDSNTTFVTPTVTPIAYKETSGIFVPYWDIPRENSYDNYEQVYYFGISANTNGVNTADPGYSNIKKFTSSVGTKNAYLTIRMLNTDDNITILENKKIQLKIIKESLQIAKDNGFKGVVLDLEIGVLPFSKVVNNINSFVADFYSSAKQNKVEFLEAIYGDTFYRKRPFDVQYLSQNSDGILIMAYDFTKASGEPGPNFPLAGKEKYGYDFKQMITDFSSIVPPEKLTVVFGMYGYDWITDLKGKTTGAGKSIALNNITSKYVDNCKSVNCVFHRDPAAAEAEINYVDSSSASYLIYHTIWFEDEKSVAQKMNFLKEKGIGSVAYWAYGYF